MPGYWSASLTTRPTYRDIAAKVGVTERSAYAIVTDLAAAGYVVKDRDTDGRRNRYQIQAHLPLPEAVGRRRASARSSTSLSTVRPHSRPTGRAREAGRGAAAPLLPRAALTK